MTRILVLLALMLPLTSLGQSVYRTVDENGNVIFTDVPPNGSTSTEQIELHPTNTAPAVEAAPAPEAPATEPKALTYTVAITAPANETTIAMGPGNFSVSATVTPSLRNNSLLQLSIDGTPSGEPQSSTTWQLTNVFRGGHDLTVEVVSDTGDQLAVSEPVRVYVLRPSVNNRPGNRGR